MLPPEGLLLVQGTTGELRNKQKKEMDEKALLSAYQYAKGNGYGGSQGDFVSLLKKDKNALIDIHGWAQSQGYKGGVDNFSALIGVAEPIPVKKKEESGLPSVEDGISLDTPETDTPKPSASSATRKVKTPSKFNKNIESSDYQRHTKLASAAIEAAKKKDATTVANTLKEMSSIRAMYPKGVFESDKQMADDLRVVNEMAKRNNLNVDVEKGAVLPAKPKAPVKINLPQGVVAKASDIKYTPDEMKKIISADMIELAGIDLDEANKIVEDEFSGDGILDKVTKTINNWTIRAGMGYIPSSTDRAIAKAANEVKSKNPNATPEEILKYAKQQRLDEVIKNQKDKAVENYFEGLSLFSPEEQNSLEATLEGVKTKQEYHIARFNEKQEKIDRNLALLGTYKAKVEKGDSLTPQEMMDAKRAINDVTLTYTDLERNYKNIESDAANLKSTEEELDRFKRNYSYITNTSTKLGANFLKILGGLADVVDMAGSGGTANTISALENPFGWGAVGEASETISNAMLSSVAKSDELKNVNSVGGFAEWAGELMVTQAPQLVVAYTTGGAAIPLMGASAGGQKFRELKDNQDYSSGQKMLASLVVGLSEGLSEKIELDVMKQIWPSSRMARAATRTKADADVFKESLRVGIKGSVLNSIETLGLAASVANKEGISELVAQLGNNITDKYVLDKDVSILDGVSDAYLSGVVIGGAMMAAPAITAKVISPFVYDPEKKVSKNVTKLSELTRALSVATKDSDKAIIQKQIDKLSAENFSIVDAAINRTKRLSPDEIREGVRAVERMQGIKAEIGEISRNNEYTPEQKNIMAEGLLQEYNELVLKRAALIDKANAVEAEEVEEQPIVEVKTEDGSGVRSEIPAGKRLFNDPNPETAEISAQYKKANNIDPNPGEKIESIDIDRAMQIADAFEAMEDTPNDPEVQKTYKMLADETKSQYDAIKNAGYTVEIWEGEGEPYANAQEMIDDVKNNKHMYIFSTEQGFGESPITEEQRAQNTMLVNTGEVDVNGKPLLYNDMFRFVHDFFGHSERGNGFGAVGEENAWDVHARMYTPLARRAMTTETRGQNSWVNFGKQMRGKNGELLQKGDPGYLSPKEREYAPQKMGLLPEEFSQIIELKPDKMAESNQEPDKMAEQTPIEGNIKETDDNYQESRDAAMALAKEQGEFVPGDATLVNIESSEDGAIESATFSFLDENKEPVTKEVVFKQSNKGKDSAKMIQNVKDAISKVFPDLDVLSFKNAKEMRKHVKDKYGDSVDSVQDNDAARVLMDENNNPIAILVNEELSDDTSIPHEVWHAILLKSFGESQALFKKFRDGIRKILSDSGYKDLVKSLDAFAAQPEYAESGVIAEEWLAQLGGELTALGIDPNNLSKKEKTLLDKLKEVINRFAVSISGRPVFSENSTPEEVLDFMMEVSTMMSKGQDVSNAVKSKKSEAKNTSTTTSRAQKTPKDRMSSVLDGVIEKSKERKAAKDKIYKEDLAYLKRSAEYELADSTRKKEMVEELRDRLGMRDNSVYENALAYLQGSSVYEKADDVEREALVREMRKKLGLKEKAVNRIFSLKRKEPGITVNERQALKSQIALEAKAAKDAIKARQAIGAMIKAQLAPLFRNGVLKTTQLQAINKKLLQLNFFNQDHVDKFLTYMDKVFRDAEYASKLAKANTMQVKIKRAAKDKTIQAETRDTAKEFARIAPYLVEDIDTYLTIADEVYGAVQQTKGTITETGDFDGQRLVADVSFKKAMDYNRVQEYVKTENAAQEEAKKQRLLDRNQYLVESGVLDGSMSLKEMQAIINGIEKNPDSEVSKDKEKVIRDYVNRYFDSYKAILTEIVDTDIDPFTGERMYLSEEQRKQISRFLDVDLDVLTLKEAYHMVNAVDNFIVNQNTDGMAATIEAYEGIKLAKKAKADGMIARPLRAFWSKALGNSWGEQFEQITMMHERLFGGVEAAIKFDKLSGMSKLLREKVVALKQQNSVIEKYSKKFRDVKDFNKASNVFERGMLGILARNSQGSEIEQYEEFKKEKNNIRITIDAMKKGTDKEKREAIIAQEVYDKIVKDSNSYQEVRDKAEPSNVKAAEFWQNEFANIFDDLQRVSRGVYNVILDRDVNYLPRKWKRFNKRKDDMESSDSSSAFFGINDGFDMAETGVLMKANKPALSEEGLPARIYSFDFDSNMSRALQGALIDINTASTIRQISAFYNSNEFSDIIPRAEDREMAYRRMTGFIRKVKKKEYTEEDSLDALSRLVNYTSSFAASRALGSLSQIPKQTISVAVNTMINTGGDISVSDVFKAKKFIDDSGYAISVRGIASQADIQTINQILKKAEDSKGKQLADRLKRVNEMYLELFVARPDVYIARASWLAYYKKKLRALGIDTNEIDWDTHELNTDAADYAQRMTDRQQNYSDPDLAGNLLSSKRPVVQLIRKSLFPFASFGINKKAQLMGDMATINNPMSSTEAKKDAIRSLASWGVEQGVFAAVSFAVGDLLYNFIANAFADYEDDEEEKKKARANALRYRAKNAAMELLSPVPVILDDGVADAINNTLSAIGVEEPFTFPESKGQSLYERVGLTNVLYQKFANLRRMSYAAATGTYIDKFGNEKQMSEDDRERVQVAASVYAFYAFGLLPSDVGAVADKAYYKIGKKSSSSSKSKDFGGGFDTKFK